MIDKLELFKLVIDTSKSYRQAYLHNFWATLGFLILAIGWFVTLSKSELKDTLISDVEFRDAIIVVVILLLIHVGVLIYTCWQSNKLFEMFKALNIDSNLQDEEKNRLFYNIPILWIIVDVAVNTILLGILVFILSKILT